MIRLWPQLEKARRDGAHEADMAVMRACVALAQEAIDKRDFETAHYHEDAGHMLVVTRAAEGQDVRELAALLLPLCRTEYPRWTA